VPQELFDIDLAQLGKVAALLDKQDEGRRDLKGIHAEVSTILHQVRRLDCLTVLLSSLSAAPAGASLAAPCRLCCLHVHALGPQEPAAPLFEVDSSG